MKEPQTEFRSQESEEQLLSLFYSDLLDSVSWLLLFIRHSASLFHKFLLCVLCASVLSVLRILLALHSSNIRSQRVKV